MNTLGLLTDVITSWMTRPPTLNKQKRSLKLCINCTPIWEGENIGFSVVFPNDSRKYDFSLLQETKTFGIFQCLIWTKSVKTFGIYPGAN